MVQIIYFLKKISVLTYLPHFQGRFPPNPPLSVINPDPANHPILLLLEDYHSYSPPSHRRHVNH